MPGGCHVKPEQFFNLIFGYYDRYAERAYTLDATAGDNRLSGTTVPAGEVWIVTFAGARNNITNPATIWLGIYNGADEYFPQNKASPGIGILVTLEGWVVLKAGDSLRALIRGCAAGDDLYLDINGYKMKVAQ